MTDKVVKCKGVFAFAIAMVAHCSAACAALESVLQVLEEPANVSNKDYVLMLTK